MSELKPCPFCGGRAVVRAFTISRSFVVCCEDCPAGFALPYDSEDEAIDAWNTRVKPGDGKSLTDEEREILNDMPALKQLAMIAGFEVER